VIAIVPIGLPWLELLLLLLGMLWMRTATIIIIIVVVQYSSHRSKEHVGEDPLVITYVPIIQSVVRNMDFVGLRCSIVWGSKLLLTMLLAATIIILRGSQYSNLNNNNNMMLKLPIMAEDQPL